MTAHPARPVGSVARALALLDELAASDTDLGVSELARRIGVNASTASRLLATLERDGYVARDPRGPYRLGLKLVALADRALARLDIRELARPSLEELVVATGETATLSVPGEHAAVTVDFVPSASSVSSVARLGRPSIAHATAAGKVMLAFAFGDDPLAAAGELARYTDRTITDPAVLGRELDAVRETRLRRGRRRARAGPRRARRTRVRPRWRARRDRRAPGPSLAADRSAAANRPPGAARGRRRDQPAAGASAPAACEWRFSSEGLNSNAKLRPGQLQG